MKTTITLTESETKQAVREYLENQTRHIEDIDHKDITVVIERDPSSGEYVAKVEFSEGLDA